MGDALLDELRLGLRGPVLAAGDPGYDQARSIWNAMIDRRPRAIARCLGVVDIQASVRFARAHELTLSVKGGGHNISGLSVCDGGLMLDLSLMRGVFVDRAAQVAHVQPGCLLGDVDRETQVHGLAAVLGFVSNTGAAGLTLGGGFGYLTRRFGWTTDNLVSLDVVTADARVVHASERENADLFWGLRGGGGNFGVVTDFEHRLHAVGPEIVAGAMAWRGEDAPQVLEMWRSLMASAPPELVVVSNQRIAPPAPWISRDAHGKPIIALFVCHTGSVTDGEQLLAPLKRFGSPVGDVVQRRPYTSQQCLIDATQPKGRRYYWKSEYLSALDPAMLDKTIDHVRRVRSPYSAIAIFPIGGALNRLPDGHSAVGNRDAAFVLNITASWDRPEDDTANIEWARAAWRDLRPFSTGGTYVNFLTEEEGADRIKAAYGKNHARLVALKTKWDPDNVFRLNKNIAPLPREIA